MEIFLFEAHHREFCVLGAVPSSPTMTISPHRPPEIGIQLECFVTYAHTPNEFYIQLVCIYGNHCLCVTMCVVMVTAAKCTVGTTYDRVAGLCY